MSDVIGASTFKNMAEASMLLTSNSPVWASPGDWLGPRGRVDFQVLDTTHPCTTSVTYFSDCSQMEQIQFLHPEYSIYSQYVLKRSAVLDRCS